MAEGDEQKKQSPRPGGGRIDGEIRMVPRGAPKDPTAVDLNMAEEQNQDDAGIPFGVDVVQYARQQEQKRQTELERLAQEDQRRAAEEDRKKAETPGQQASATPEANPYSPAKQKMDALQKPQPAQPAGEQNETPPQRVAFGGDENEAARDRAKQAEQGYTDRTRQALSNAYKNLKEKFTKDTVKAYLKALFYSESFPLITGIIVLLLGLGLVGYGYYIYHSGANGTTPTQAVNSIDNKSLLEKLNLLAGDKDTQKQLSTEVMTEAQKNLTALKDQTALPATKTKIDKALTDTTKYLATPSPELGNSIIAQIRLILDDIGNFAPQIQGRSPVDPAVISSYNTDLHYNTPLNQNSQKNGSGHSTYIQLGKNTCDAVDIITKKSTGVFPVFTGEVVDVSLDGTGMSDSSKIVIKNGDYQVLYAFVSPTVKKGDKITDINKSIGTANLSQVHLELAYKGKCLVTTPTDKADHESKKPFYTYWGEYLWSHIKYTLKI